MIKYVKLNSSIESMSNNIIGRTWRRNILT